MTGRLLSNGARVKNRLKAELHRYGSGGSFRMYTNPFAPAAAR